MPDLAGRGPRAAPARLAWAGALAMALASLLFLPRVRARLQAPALSVVVVDASASAVRTRAGWADWIRARLEAQARNARAAGRELALVRCARGVELLLGPARLDPAAAALAPVGPARGQRPDDDRTDLAGAVRLAEGLLAGRAEGALILLGDGSFTGADPRPGLRRLARRGISIEREDPPAPDRPDLALAELRLARALEPGAPLVAELALVNRGGALPAGSRIELEVELAGPAGTRRVQLAGPSLHGAAASQRLDLGTAVSGRTELRASARLRAPGLEGDAVPENDQARAVVVVGEVLVVAALAAESPGGSSGDPSEGGPAGVREDWEAWCAGLEGLGGLQVLHASPESFASLRGAVDAVVSLDLPLASAGALGLADFVAAGGGWLALGGYALTAGAPAGAGSVDVAPLLAAEGPRRRVLFLVDGSGSMSGAPYDELVRAVLAAMEVAPASDHFELAWFTDAIESRHVLGSGGLDTAGAARALLAARAPRGATDVLAALREVAAGAELPELVLLLTDGRDQPGPQELGGQALALREALGAGGARLVVVGVGADQDAAALEALAGEAVPRRASEGLALVFREELGRGRWTPPGRYTVAVREPASLAPDGLALPLASAFAGLPLAPLERLQRTRLAPGAEAVLEGPSGPLLAVRAHGRGWVAAFAGAPVRGFAGAWTARPELLGPVVRALGRGRGTPPEVRLTWGPGGSRVGLAGVPPDWPALVLARFDDGSLLRLAPPAQVPGADPRSHRTSRSACEAAGPGSVTLLAGWEPANAAALATAPDPLARDSEFSPTPRTLGALPRPGVDGGAEAGGGPGAGAHPAAPWLLGLGLLLVGLAAALGWDRGGGPPSAIGGRGR